LGATCEHEKFKPWVMSRSPLWVRRKSRDIKKNFSRHAYLRQSPSIAIWVPWRHDFQSSIYDDWYVRSNVITCNLDLFGLRFQVPMCYEDAHGNLGSTITHCMLLPHEVVGTFFRFPHLDLMARLIGPPGETQLWSCSVFGWGQPAPAKYLAAHRQGIDEVLGGWEAYVLVPESPDLQGDYVGVDRFVHVGSTKTHFPSVPFRWNLYKMVSWFDKTFIRTLSKLRRLTQTMSSRCVYLVMEQRAIATCLTRSVSLSKSSNNQTWSTLFFKKVNGNRSL
jgi:hypothetical protein